MLFLLPGHTHNEADQAHTAIAESYWSAQLWGEEDWMALLKGFPSAYAWQRLTQRLACNWEEDDLAQLTGLSSCTEFLFQTRGVSSRGLPTWNEAAKVCFTTN